MKNQKVQVFTGNYILPFGKPIVIVTGWETETHLYCERFVMFQKRNNRMICKGMCTNISKLDYKAVYNPEDEEQILQEFMNQKGKEMAEDEVFDIIAGMMDEMGNWERAVNIEIRLISTRQLVSLVLLNRNFSSDLGWMYENTQLPMLKELITLAKRFKSTESRY